MGFRKGRSGNPIGGKKPAVFYEALMLSLKRIDPAGSDRTQLQRIADKLVELAAQGDVQAIKEIGNRLDGTPAQTVDMNVNDNRTPAELSDADLADIAAGSGAGTAGPEGSPAEPDRLH